MAKVQYLHTFMLLSSSKMPSLLCSTAAEYFSSAIIKGNVNNAVTFLYLTSLLPRPLWQDDTTFKARVALRSLLLQDQPQGALMLPVQRVRFLVVFIIQIRPMVMGIIVPNVTGLKSIGIRYWRLDVDLDLARTITPTLRTSLDSLTCPLLKPSLIPRRCPPK